MPEFSMGNYVQIRADAHMDDELRRHLQQTRHVGQIVGTPGFADGRYLVRFDPMLIDFGFVARELILADSVDYPHWTPQVHDVVQVKADHEPRMNGTITGVSETGDCEIRFENDSTDCYPVTALIFVAHPETRTISVDARIWNDIREALRITTDYIDDEEVLINDLYFHEIDRRIRDNRRLLKES